MDGRLDLNSSVSPLTFDWQVRFEQEPTRLAYAYWKECRRDRPMPSRVDLNPVAMQKFTKHVGLIDVNESAEASRTYFIRRAGTSWEEVYGPITGHFTHEFLSPAIEKSWRDVFDAVVAAKAPVRVVTRIDFQGKTWLRCEMFVAPLGEKNEVAMLFMTFVAWPERAV